MLCSHNLAGIKMTKHVFFVNSALSSLFAERNEADA
jgi:hypothetical protein